MELINPKVELWSELGLTPEQHIARCARVCYGHQGEGKDPVKLVNTLIKSGHVSMLRHASRYFVYKDVKQGDAVADMDLCPYNQTRTFSFGEGLNRNVTVWLSTNEQEYRFSYNFVYGVEPEQVMTLDGLLEHCRQQPEIFDIVRLTFCCTTQISTSRELNRVSPNNIAERSTRYCSSKFGLQICKPWWWNEKRNQVIAFEPAYPEQESMQAWQEAEEHYQRMLDLGMKPEDARGLLPLDTATVVVYTYSAREWARILDLRYYGTTGTPHPNAKLIAGMIRDQINAFAREHGIDRQL